MYNYLAINLLYSYTIILNNFIFIFFLHKIYKFEKILKVIYMKKLILSFLYLLFTPSLFSQSSENLLILNEGYFDFTNQEIIEPVSIGVYNTNSQVYQEVIVIDGVRFASDMIVDGNILYVAADNKIIKYQIGSFEYIDEVEMQGARNLLIHNDNLFVSRGDYDYDTWSAVVFDSYLHVYDKNNLTLISEFDTNNGPSWSTQNLVAKDDQVFVAVNNGFEWNNEKGYVGVIDISTLTYTNEFDLGENGTNPDNMVIKGDYILTVNNKNWSGSSISRINLTSNEVITENLADVSTGCGTSALRGDYLNFQVSQDSTLNKYDINNMETMGVEQSMNLNFYELIESSDGLFYASSTDFFSYGDVHIFNQDNEIVNSFSAGVTPGVFAFYSLSGCTDQEACNYDEFSSEDDGSCIYAEEGYDCDGVELEENTIVDIIVDSENHNTLETALMVAGLVETLSSDGPWTIFAPTDAAFESLPDGLLDDLLANTESLTNTLSHHVVSGIGLSTDLYDDYNGLTVPTLNDTEILVTIDGNAIMIDNALIITADLVADNGVVHVIDTVLLPEGGCVDDNSIIDDAFQTLSTCSGTIDFLMTNYGYSNEEACLWDGNMGNGSLFGGLSMVDFCECSCADFSNLSILQSSHVVKEILYKVDILGNIIKNQEILNSPYFIVYRDGSVKKFVKIK